MKYSRFTMVELIVALVVLMAAGELVSRLLVNTSQMQRHTEQSLQALQVGENTAGRLEHSDRLDFATITRIFEAECRRQGFDERVSWSCHRQGNSAIIEIVDGKRRLLQLRVGVRP